MIIIRKAFGHALLLLLFCVSWICGDPYVLYDDTNSLKDGNGGFSLCLGASPSNELRDSLLMCRELSYEFCVNSSLVGSVLRVDSSTARHFVASLSEPTENNIERLAWLIDSALVLLYDSFSSQSTAHVKCAHEWRSWVCSRAFKRATNRLSDGTGGFPLPLCANTCTKAEDACNSNLQCAARDEVVDTEQCTDFYKDSGEVCNKASSKDNSKKQTVPVFRKHDTNKDSDRWWNSSNKLYIDKQLCAILFAAYLATIACR
jgi:hypothetical protein